MIFNDFYSVYYFSNTITMLSKFTVLFIGLILLSCADTSSHDALLNEIESYEKNYRSKEAKLVAQAAKYTDRVGVDIADLSVDNELRALLSTDDLWNYTMSRKSVSDSLIAFNENSKSYTDYKLVHVMHLEDRLIQLKKDVQSKKAIDSQAQLDFETLKNEFELAMTHLEELLVDLDNSSAIMERTFKEHESMATNLREQYGLD